MILKIHRAASFLRRIDLYSLWNCPSWKVRRQFPGDISLSSLGGEEAARGDVEIDGDRQSPASRNLMSFEKRTKHLVTQYLLDYESVRNKFVFEALKHGEPGEGLQRVERQGLPGLETRPHHPTYLCLGNQVEVVEKNSPKRHISHALQESNSCRNLFVFP